MLLQKPSKGVNDHYKDENKDCDSLLKPWSHITNIYNKEALCLTGCTLQLQSPFRDVR